MQDIQIRALNEMKKGTTSNEPWHSFQNIVKRALTPDNFCRGHDIFTRNYFIEKFEFAGAISGLAQILTYDIRRN